MSKRLLENIEKQLVLMRLDEQSKNKALELFLKNWEKEREKVSKQTDLEDSDSTEPDETDSDLDNLQDVGDTEFDKIVEDVINRLEGGYYHPDMKSDGRCPTCGRMGDSGETMFGMDRKHGVNFAKSSAGQEFWEIIDDSGARNNWKWNYKGGNLAPRLKRLVTKMIQPAYENLSQRYLSPEAQKIVNSNPGLIFNFAYATWNGPGWFQKFAKKVNDAVKNGIKDPEELTKVAIDARLNSGNSIIAQGGRKVSNIINSSYA